MRKFGVFLSIFFYICTGVFGQNRVNDSVRVVSLLHESGLKKYSSSGKLVVFFGKSLLETDYVPNVLDVDSNERLIVNLEQLDCVTFVENVLALTLAAKSNHPSFECFKRYLQLIRFRSGIINGYPSRLHYFSDWIADNAMKGIVEEKTANLSSTVFPMDVWFMGRNSDKYPALAKNKAFVDSIRIIEKRLNKSKPIYYINRNAVASVMKKIQDGDIVAITSGIKGLDVLHVGIAVKKNGVIHLMHASSKGKKVIIDTAPLHEQVLRLKSQNGIRIISVL